MKVLHINTSIGGGAGIAAYRLHKGLLKHGVESTFLFLNSTTGHITKKAKPKPTTKVKTYYYLSKFLKRLGLKKKEAIATIETATGNYEIFTSPISNYDITLHPAYKEADVINLHWVSDFLDFPSFFTKNDKPIVWTLHDMNPFQGGFHYYQDVLNNEHVFDLEEKFKKIKQVSVSKCKSLHVVGLSKWILDASKRSDIFKIFPHSLIHNGIDFNLFKPLDKSHAREIFCLPHNKTIILFLSQDSSNRRKGFDILLQTVKDFNDREDILFCAVGINSFENSQKNLHCIDLVKDERLLPIIYSAADVFILPSREDNLPNVMLEALACGTPVISTPVGGMLDIIINGFNGLLTKDVSSESLNLALNEFLRDRSMYKISDIRENIYTKVSIDVQVKKYHSLYEHLLRQPNKEISNFLPVQ